MKLKLLSIATLFVGLTSAGAFSLDFTGLNLDGSTTFSGADGQRLIIEVPGFGNVGFGVNPEGSTAQVVELDGVAAIEFDETRTITVDFFAGSDVENVVVSFVALNVGEDPIYTAINSRSGEISTNQGTVGISGISFDRIGGPKVPEPSTAVLGLLGAVTLLRRRR